MRIHLSSVDDSELLGLLTERVQQSKAGHVLVADAADAEMVLLVGSFGDEPDRLLKHPAYVAYPDKCAVYTEDDNYLPLAPGIYCSAQTDEHAKAGRTFSYAYVSRNGQYSNAFLPDEAPAEKKYLFSFQGGSTSLLRKRMFNLNFGQEDVLIENTSTYYHWDLTQPDRKERQQRYADILAGSHFVLCPRGAGTGSIRLFEVMHAGVAPVLIADDYLLPAHIDWDKFLLRIPEREIGRLSELIEPHVATSAERGRLAREAYLANFVPAMEFDRVVEDCYKAVHHGPPGEVTFRRSQQKMIAQLERKRRFRALAKTALLKTLKVLRIKNPYQMNDR